MNESVDNKITFLQAILIYLVALYTPTMRYITSTTAAMAHQASWLSGVSAMIIYIPLLLMIYCVAKKFEGRSLYDILLTVFGKVIGVFLSFLLLLWLMILFGLYLKYLGENLVTTEFIGTDINLMILIAVLLVGVVLRWGLPVLSRMNKIIFVLIIIQFVIILFFLFLHFKPDYITPLSALDIGPVLMSSIYPLTLWVYITPVFIFNDQINYDKKNKGKLLFTAGYLTVKNMLMMLALLGMLSYPLVSKFKLPFFSAVENISVFNSSAGLDSLFLSIWMLAEFVTISFFAYCISRLIKNMFRLKRDVPALTAILGFGLFFAAYFNSNLFQIIAFSNYIAPVLNLSVGLFIPVALFVTAKIRKMI